jgi:hypothetical protein
VPDVEYYHRSTLGTYLKFVNREQSINTLLKHVKSQYGFFISPETTPDKSVRLAACSGGPGLGKTTFCRKAFTKAVDAIDEEKRVIWEGVDDTDGNFKEVVTKCVTDGRQFRISFGIDSPLGAELRFVHYANSLALRLLEAKTKNTRGDCHLLPENDTLLKDVVSKISGGDGEALIVLNLDETNTLESDISQEYLKGILAHIQKINKLKIGFVFVILSGTNVRKLHDLMVQTSAVAPLEIPLPLLTKMQVQDILKNLAIRTANEQPKIGPELDFAVQVLGGVPRYVEMLAFCLGSNDHSDFRHSTYKEIFKCSIEPDAKVLLQRVKAMLLEQYGNKISKLLSGLPLEQLMCMSLFGWNVTRETKVGDNALGDLESNGIVFFQEVEKEFGETAYTIHLPLLMTLVGAQTVLASKVRLPMLLKHFDVMLSSDENERNFLALLALKCSGLQKTFTEIELKLLLPLNLFPNLAKEWSEKTLEFTSFKQFEAAHQVNRQNWTKALKKFKKEGAFVQNCRGASFGDMIIVPKGGAFSLIIQEKQGEGAKKKRIGGRKSATRKLSNVLEEHAKCNVSTPHLFVFVTDEEFNDFEKLESNEIVLSYEHHEAVMGPLCTLLRKFNHSKIQKIAIK